MASHLSDASQKAASPIAAPIPRPLNVQSLFPMPNAAGPSSKPASKPASTAPVDIDPQSQAHAETLARLGIKVRDFAYESKLPPIRPFRVRQIQPGLRPLKRIRGDGEEIEDVFYVNPAGSSAAKKTKLDREVTEPDVQQPSNNPIRARGFVNLDEYDFEIEGQSQSQSEAVSSQQSDWEASVPPLRLLDSEDSEPYIDTPLVTPNGSLQWKIQHTSDIPASQLDTESQSNEPELLSYSQLGMEQPADNSDTGLFGNLTPMSSLSSVTSDPSAPSPKPLRDVTLPQPPTSKYDTSHLQSSTRPLINTKPPTPPVPTSRYQLRKRSAPTLPQPPIKTSTHSRRTVHPPVHPLSRPAFSIQSSHSRKKAQSSTSTPHSRTLRKRTVGAS